MIMIGFNTLSAQTLNNRVIHKLLYKIKLIDQVMLKFIHYMILVIVWSQNYAININVWYYGGSSVPSNYLSECVFSII